MYYLQSRYYDPAIGRFINADTFATTDADGFLNCNMFAYCENNPINRKDSEGYFTWEAVLGGAIAGAFLGAATSVIDAYIAGEPITAKTILNGGLEGAVSGAVSGLTTAITLIPRITKWGRLAVKCVGSLVNAGITTAFQNSSSNSNGSTLASAGAAFTGTFIGASLPAAPSCDSFGLQTAYYSITGTFVGGIAEGLADSTRLRTTIAISSFQQTGYNSSNTNCGGYGVMRMCTK